MKKITLAAGLIAAAGLAQARAADWAPYVNAELYGGRTHFSGSDVNGLNGSATFVPGFRLGDKMSILPSISYGYRRTRDVQEVAGGGFLTQQNMDVAAGLKGVYALGPAWRAKGYGSYKKELSKETADESWSNGLFNYNKTAGGVELERQGGAVKSLRFGLDYYLTKFPNFQSLASRQFGAEINAGKDVLDFRGLDASVGGDVALGPNAQLSAYFMASNRSFGDQHIVKKDGTFSSDLRKDLFTYVSAGLRRQLPPARLGNTSIESLAGLDVSYGRLDSNQNNYDAGQTKFNPNFYDYSEVGAGPRFNVRFREKLTAGVSWMWSRRAYGDRPVQASDGKYGSAAIASTVNTLRFSAGYPIMKSLSFQVIGAFQHAASNMDYESVYRYNYSSANYFAGLSYSL